MAPVRRAATPEPEVMTESHVAWLRRDLRLHDHHALVAAARGASPGGRLAVLFVLDAALLDGASANRAWFMLETLRELAADLERLGSALFVRQGRPEDVVPAFAREVGAAAVHVSRDYAPYGRRRDERVAAALRGAGANLHRHAGVLVQEPEAVTSATGRGFRVFGAFHRAWSTLAPRPIEPLPAVLPPAPDVARGVLPPPPTPTADPALLPAPGERAARERLARWLDGPIDEYDRLRDRLDLDGTSRLSQDLRFGLLSAGEVAARSAGPRAGRRRFLAELAWRDFFAHFLWHEPDLARRAFRPEMDAAFGPAAGPRAALVDAWRNGATGYPAVDAGIRQLAATGWLPNRARMIAASFLAKHLLVDRRVGEAHFWRHLVDGDLASNNGNWQWIASTGADAQPWFRIFNPVLQGRRFDPDGAWVRRWVPELANVATQHVHAPWEAPEPPAGYPAPIVRHDEARSRALAALSAAAAGSVGGPSRPRPRRQSAARRASQPASPRRTS